MVTRTHNLAIKFWGKKLIFFAVVVSFGHLRFGAAKRKRESEIKKGEHNNVQIRRSNKLMMCLAILISMPSFAVYLPRKAHTNNLIIFQPLLLSKSIYADNLWLHKSTSLKISFHCPTLNFMFIAVLHSTKKWNCNVFFSFSLSLRFFLFSVIILGEGEKVIKLDSVQFSPARFYYP